MAQNYALNEIKSRMDEIILSMVENPAPDYTSYLKRVGQYNGLKEAVQIVVRAEDEDEFKPTF